MKPPLTYDELLGGYYGRHPHHHSHARWRAGGGHLTESAAQLFAGYYGRPPPPDPTRTRRAPLAAVSFSVDDGEMLDHRASRNGFEEYVVQSSLSHAADEEYVIGGTSNADDAAPHRRHRNEHVEPRDEYEVDIADPLGSSAGKNQFDPPEPRPPVPERPMTLADDNPVAKQTLPSQRGAPAGAPAETTEDDFVADMQAILGGQKLYDPIAKKTVDADPTARQQASSDRTGQGTASGNGQAIFDKIAQSMQYANKYDLGTVELENRFADFDRISDLQDRGPSSKPPRDEKRAPTQPALAATTAVDSQDFLQDLDTIHHRRGSSPGKQSDTGDDPFAYLPPSSADPASGAAPMAGPNTPFAPSQAGAAAQVPSIQIPNIQIPGIPMPNIQIPNIPAPNGLNPNSQIPSPQSAVAAPEY